MQLFRGEQEATIADSLAFLANQLAATYIHHVLASVTSKARQISMGPGYDLHSSGVGFAVSPSGTTSSVSPTPSSTPLRHSLTSLLLPIFLPLAACSHDHHIAQCALHKGQSYLHLSHRGEDDPSQCSQSSTPKARSGIPPIGTPLCWYHDGMRMCRKFHGCSRGLTASKASSKQLQLGA